MNIGNRAVSNNTYTQSIYRQMEFLPKKSSVFGTMQKVTRLMSKLSFKIKWHESNDIPIRSIIFRIVNCRSLILYLFDVLLMLKWKFSSFNAFSTFFKHFIRKFLFLTCTHYRTNISATRNFVPKTKFYANSL